MPEPPPRRDHSTWPELPPFGSTAALPDLHRTAPGLPRHRLPRPQVIAGRYELLGELGRGGMGTVLRARDRSSGAPIALKLLHADKLDERLRARFRREGQITAALRHPGIVRVHALGESEGLPYLAYELVEGARTLGSVLDSLPLRRRVELIRDAAAALGYAHAQGVVHRDVKPENLLIDEAERLKVADFGLARVAELERLTQSGMVLGTPTHMAPEQLVGEERLGPPIDTWALGVILYQALTDRLPFGGNTLLALGAQIAAADPVPPRELDPSLPAELEAVCLRCLRADPGARYPDGAALAAELNAWLAGAGVEALPERPLRRFLRRRRRALVGGGFLVLGGGGLLLASLWPQPPAPAPDRAPPRIELEPCPAETWAEAVELRGRVLDASAHELRLNEERLPLDPQGGFLHAVSLAPGENRLLLRARDSADNASQREIRVLRRVLPDWVEALAPEQRPPLPLPGGLRFGAGPGEVLNEADGSVLCWIPPGSFTMGGSRGNADEEPAHQVTFTRGFYLGKFELSSAAYLRFCQETQREAPEPRGWVNAPLRGDYPVHSISWHDALAYCAWARLRLPSEAEWEYAAQGGDAGRRFPWGDEPGGPRGSNTRGAIRDGFEWTCPVDRFPRDVSRFGVRGLGGNVQEWTMDCYEGGYDSPRPVVDPRPSERGAERVCRGGVWDGPRKLARSRNRNGQAPEARSVQTGFRVARDP